MSHLLTCETGWAFERWMLLASVKARAATEPRSWFSTCIIRSNELRSSWFRGRVIESCYKGLCPPLFHYELIRDIDYTQGNPKNITLTEHCGKTFLWSHSVCGAFTTELVVSGLRNSRRAALALNKRPWKVHGKRCPQKTAVWGLVWALTIARPSMVKSSLSWFS